MSQVIDGRYEILERLGEGGMGEVYKVRDSWKEETKALKIFSKLKRSKEDELYLQHEFLIAARLNHPHIVQMYDFGRSDEGLPYFSMEYVEGFSINKTFADLDYGRLYSVLVQVCEALDYVHAQGLIHGDLKPSNIIVTKDGKDRTPDSGGEAKLLDFGLARRFTIPELDRGISGTFEYMAPEMVTEETIDQRADLYSLGVLLYELVAKALPFTGESPRAVLLEKMEKAPVPLREYNELVPEELEKVIFKLLQRKPMERFQSAYEVISALEKLRRRRPEKRWLKRPFLFAGEFVGREKELDRLKGLLDIAIKGEGSFVLVGGEAGVGKSRLLRELKFQAQLKGASFYEGKCTPDVANFYQPFQEILSPIIEMESSRIFQKWERELARIIPEIVGSRLLTAIREVELEPEKEKLRLGRAVMQFLVESSQLHPLVLLFEDLHWGRGSG